MSIVKKIARFNKILDDVESSFRRSVGELLNTGFINSRYTELYIYFGGYICDSIIKQETWLNTSELIKIFAMQFPFLKKERIIKMIEICNKIQRSVVRKTQDRLEKRYYSVKICFLGKKLTELIKSTEILDFFERNPDRCKIAIIYGYCLYDEKFRAALFRQKDKTDVKETDKVYKEKDSEESIQNNSDEIGGRKEIEDEKNKQEDTRERGILNWEMINNELNTVERLPLYKEWPEFGIGLYIGALFFKTLGLQTLRLKTRRLEKYIYHIKRMDDKKLGRFICVLCETLIKLTGLNLQKREKNWILTRPLYGAEWLLKVIERLFITNFHVKDRNKIIWGINSGIILSNLPEAGDIETKLYRLESEEVLGTPVEKLGWLTGIMIGAVCYREKKTFGVSTLAKNIYFYIQRMDISRYIRLLNEICYISLKVAVNKKQNYFPIHPDIIGRIIKILGEIDPDKFEPNLLFISISKGYNTYRLHISDFIKEIADLHDI